MKITEYDIYTKQNYGITIALASDLHDKNYKKIEESFDLRKPDMIVIPGDLVTEKITSSQNAIGFLNMCAKKAPSFYSLGNHEKFDTEDYKAVKASGVILLDNSHTHFGGINIGGLTCALHNEDKTPDLQWLDRFAALGGFKLLLCHHPEYYTPYIKQRDISLTVSGHAHGGQIRLFGRGLYAPGQGLFPKYTSGVHENRLVISRGLANTAGIIPRLWNDTELVYINLKKRQAAAGKSRLS